MIKYLIIFSFNKVFSQDNSQEILSVNISKDSINQYSKEWFIQSFGDDQNSKDIIDFYFFRYKDYKNTHLIALIIGVPSTIAFALLINNPNGHLLLLGFGIPILGSIIISSIVSTIIVSTIYTIISLHKYDSKHLLIALQDYHKTRVFLKSKKRNPVFYKT